MSFLVETREGRENASKELTLCFVASLCFSLDFDLFFRISLYHLSPCLYPYSFHFFIPFACSACERKKNAPLAIPSAPVSNCRRALFRLRSRRISRQKTKELRNKKFSSKKRPTFGSSVPDRELSLSSLRSVPTSSLLATNHDRRSMLFTTPSLSLLLLLVSPLFGSALPQALGKRSSSSLQTTLSQGASSLFAPGGSWSSEDCGNFFRFPYFVNIFEDVLTSSVVVSGVSRRRR